MFLPLGLTAQVIDSVVDAGVGRWEPDTVYVLRTDTVRLYRTDTLHIYHTDTVIRREADTAALKALQEKEELEAERNYYIHMVDSLRALVRIAEMENVRKQEENKYLAERAKAAEDRVAQATNRKKKIRPIQGVAMRFYRTP